MGKMKLTSGKQQTSTLASTTKGEGLKVELKLPELDRDGPSSTSSSVPVSFSCRTCYKSFPTKTKLNGHTRVHLKSKHKCEDCGKEFSGPSPLKYHRWIHVGKGLRDYACEQPGCGKRFKSAQDLRRHDLVHSGTRPHQCDRCDRAFNLEWVLREHKKIHDGIRPYKCNEKDCGKAFFSQKDLKRHKAIHGSETPLKCGRGDCLKENRGFRRKDNFIRHLIAVHNLPKDEAKMISEEAEFVSELSPTLEVEGIYVKARKQHLSRWTEKTSLRIKPDPNIQIKGSEINISDDSHTSSRTGFTMIELICVKHENDFTAAMTSVKILTSIFKNLNIMELQRCRLVCHLWNEIASQVLERSIRNTNKKITCSTAIEDKLQELQKFNLKGSSTILKEQKKPLITSPSSETNQDLPSSTTTTTISNSTEILMKVSQINAAKPPTLRFLTTAPSTSRQPIRMVTRKNSVSRCVVSIDSVSCGASLDVLADVALQQAEMKSVVEGQPPPDSAMISTPIKKPRYSTEGSTFLGESHPSSFQASQPSTADSTITSSAERKGNHFENAVIFIGNKCTGKSHLCNEIFELYKSATRFSVSRCWGLGEPAQESPSVATLVLEGLNYTIIDTPGFLNDTLGPNLCSIVNVMELCKNIKAIVYVFTDSFNSSNLLLLKNLYALVGQENVLLIMNKLNKAELNQLPQLKSSMCNQLLTQNVPLEQSKFLIMGVKFREADSPLDITGCLSHLHTYLGPKTSFFLKDLKVPEACFNESQIVSSKPYEMVVNPDMKEDMRCVVYKFLEKRSTTNGSVSQETNNHGFNGGSSSGIPRTGHYIEYATFVNEYRVRYDGNVELFGMPKEIPGTRRKNPIEIQ